MGKCLNVVITLVISANIAYCGNVSTNNVNKSVKKKSVITINNNKKVIQPKKVVVKKVDEKELVASVLVAEAGGEGVNGMRAVMEVIRNRGKLRNITLNKVVLEHNAFSCLIKYRYNQQAFIDKWKKHPYYTSALWIVNNYKGNITRNANYYHEKRLKPSWSKNEKPVAVIGNHKFFAIVGAY